MFERWSKAGVGSRSVRFRASVVMGVAPFLLAAGTLTAGAQDHHDHDHDRFYNGVREGQRGGYYGGDRDYGRRGDDRRYDDHQGGIGPGKGALIGGAGGAVLGALFGGGVKGALIGGGVGAGIGAIAGKSHQDSERRDDYYRH
jgi:hypothetical protein